MNIRLKGELVDYLLSKKAIQTVIFVNGSVTINSGVEGGTESETGDAPCSTAATISSCLGVTLSGVYQLSVGNLIQCVYCECSPPFPTRVPTGECWLQVQRNDGSDKAPQKDFYLRTWTEYQNGFGSPDGDHWLGLDALHLITANGPEMRMLYEVGFVDELIVPAFQIDNAQNLYRVMQPTSDVSSDLQVIAYNAPFSTIDEDNLNNPFGQPSEFYGGYWYGSPSTILNINNEPLTSRRIKRMYIKF
ncbi:fibrinogen-like protein 1-like protein [Ochlerotatus camptorhynchus]|uniref:fibrinogen-like protein 1-like protein n=1 Tax=Ochlerotatus camptorhynchus TaxID=644619 RepID=UPI0031E266A8